MTLKRKYAEKIMEKNDCTYYDACVQLGMTEDEILEHIREELLLYHLNAIESKYIEKLVEMVNLFGKLPNAEREFVEMMATLSALSTLFGKVRMSYSDIVYFLKQSDHDYADFALVCLEKYSDRWLQNLEKYIQDFKTGSMLNS